MNTPRRAIDAEESNAFFEGTFAATSVMAILRGLSPDETVALCQRAWEAGVELVEVPIQRPEAHESLFAAASAAKRSGHLLGVGTVTRTDQVDIALHAGASFTVAPGLDTEVLAASLAAGLPHLPGVATPSEVQVAVRHGLCWVKLFPAAELSPAWLRALRAPFPDLCVVATGGIDAHNAEAFLGAGACAVAVGSALADPAQMPFLAALQHKASGRRPGS